MTASALPAWSSVLAVVAHPDDESFGLGAVLSAFIDAGSKVSVLCFTRGEASTLRGVEGDLATIRAHELQEAAKELGITDVRLEAYPDGGLCDVDFNLLDKDTRQFVARVNPDGLVTFDPTGVTGHPDHQRATEVAAKVAFDWGIGLLGWTVPDAVAQTLNEEFGSTFSGHQPNEIDIAFTVDRGRQRKAVDCHPSQAVPGSVLWRRLELLGDREHLRWIYQPGLL